MNDWASVTNARWHRWVLPTWFARIVRKVTKPLYGGRTADAITLSHTTWFLNGQPSRTLERHELEHVIECVEYEVKWWPRWLGRTWTGTVRYGIAYSLEYMRNGYHLNRFEVRARRAADQE